MAVRVLQRAAGRNRPRASLWSIEQVYSTSIRLQLPDGWTGFFNENPARYFSISSIFLTRSTGKIGFMSSS